MDVGKKHKQAFNHPRDIARFILKYYGDEVFISANVPRTWVCEHSSNAVALFIYVSYAIEVV